MQKRVLVGLVQQKNLPRTVKKICRKEMDDLALQMRMWLDEPEFAHVSSLFHSPFQPSLVFRVKGLGFRA